MAMGAEASGLPHRSVSGLRDRLPIMLVSALALALSVVGLALMTRPDAGGTVFRTTGWEGLAQALLTASLLVTGLLLRIRRPDLPLGWILVWLGLVTGASSMLWGLMLAELSPTGDRAIGQAAAWCGAVIALPSWTCLAAILVVRFPTGRPSTSTEAVILRLAPIAAIAAAIAVGLRPGPLLVYPAFDNPILMPGALGPLLEAVSAAALVVAIVPFIGAAVEKVRRYRAATSVERAQLRWFAFAAAITLTAGLLYLVFGVLVAPDSYFVREGTYVLFVVSAASLPIAVLVAISRYHLYDIDRIIGRTVAYGALTAILAGLYAASVRLFNALFVVATGQTSEVALVLTTLVLATTFTPIKGSLERLAAKRFPPDPEAVAIAGADGTLSTGVDGATAGADPVGDLDARIESIARRVAEDVLREARPER